MIRQDYLQAVLEAVTITTLFMLVGLPFVLTIANVVISRRWKREDRAAEKKKVRAKLTVVQGGRGASLTRDKETR